MGTSDSNSVPVIIFAIAYLGFITLMYSIIDIPTQTNSTNLLLLTDSSSCDCGSISCTEYGALYGTTTVSRFGELMNKPSLNALCASQSNNNMIFGNFVTNFQALGSWNLLFFSPILLALAYLIIVLLIPSFL